MFGFANKKQYADSTDKELLTNFRSENWDKLSNNKRIAVLQEVENRNAASQGRTPCTVKSTDSKSEYGCYYPSTNKIEVNVNDHIKGENGERISNNSYQVLDTIYHEGEHAHQKNCVNNQIGPPQGLSQTTRDFCNIENSKDVYPEFDEKTGNQIGGVMTYNHCTCELDSNNVAARKVMESKDIFRGDKKYDEYLDNREQYFKQASNLDMGTVRMEQYSAIDKAYDNGDISQEKCDDMKLNAVRSEQPAFREAKNIYGEIKTERAVNRENSERSNASTIQSSTDKSIMYSEYASAEKGYRDAYEKGDMKTAKEYQEKMDKAMSEAKEQEIEAEQSRAASETISKTEGSEKTRN